MCAAKDKLMTRRAAHWEFLARGLVRTDARWRRRLALLRAAAHV